MPFGHSELKGVGCPAAILCAEGILKRSSAAAWAPGFGLSNKLDLFRLGLTVEGRGMVSCVPVCKERVLFF